jgi:hypothetical protein
MRRVFRITTVERDLRFPLDQPCQLRASGLASS